MTLSREQIDAARTDLKPERIPVPEWGGDVLMRPLTVGDQEHLDETAPEGLTDRQRALRAVLCSLVDENGERQFEGTMEDLEWFQGALAKTATLLLEEFNRLNGSVKEAVEGFEPAPSEGSTTA